MRHTTRQYLATLDTETMITVIEGLCGFGGFDVNHGPDPDDGKPIVYGSHHLHGTFTLANVDNAWSIDMDPKKTTTVRIEGDFDKVCDLLSEAVHRQINAYEITKMPEDQSSSKTVPKYAEMGTARFVCNNLWKPEKNQSNCWTEGNENMSDITISIPSDPFRTVIKTIIAEESLPTLFTRDTVATFIESDKRIRDEIHNIAESVVDTHSGAIDNSIREAINDSRTIECTIKRIVDNFLDYIELADLAAHFSISDVASEINLGDLASEINLGDLANEISMSSLATEVVERGINYELLAKALLREIRSECN